MKAAAVSPFVPIKTSTKAVVEDTLGLDSITSSSTLPGHACDFSRPNTTLPSPPSPARWLDKVLDFLGWILVVLGLLPGGRGGPKQSFSSILKICLAAVTVGFLSSAYIIIECKTNRQQVKELSRFPAVIFEVVVWLS